MDLQTFFTFLVLGTAVSAVYAISATGLVVTYITSGVFNFAHGAIGHVPGLRVLGAARQPGLADAARAARDPRASCAPAIGVLLDVLVMRRLLRGASVATKLVVTLALLLAFQGLALAIWGIELRTLPGLWGTTAASRSSTSSSRGTRSRPCSPPSAWPSGSGCCSAAPASAWPCGPWSTTPSCARSRA